MFTNAQVVKSLPTLYDVHSPIEGLAMVAHKAKCVLKCVFDCAIAANLTVASHALVDDLGNPATLPKGAIVTRTYWNAVTAVTSSGSATLAFDLLTAGDMLAATAKATLSLAALGEGIQDGTVTHFLQCTADTIPTATVATAALLLGKVNFFIEYVISNP